MIMSFVGALSTLLMVAVAVGFMVSVELRQYRCRRELRTFEKFAQEAPKHGSENHGAV